MRRRAMLRRVRRRLTILVVSFATAATAAAAALPAAAAGSTWKPGFSDALNYAQSRAGVITFALRTPHHVWAYRPNHTEPSASVIKAMILVAYLDLPDVRYRKLSSGERDEVSRMIEYSDDQAANDIFYNHVGFDGLNRLASKVHMKHFSTHPGGFEAWGRTSIAAADQTKLFLHLEHYIAPRHRSLALHLLNSIQPGYGRWGIWDVSTPGWSLYEKSGWGAGTGWVDSQSALLKRGKMRLALTILTHNDPDHTYGMNTLRGIAGRLLHHLGQNSHVK